MNKSDVIVWLWDEYLLDPRIHELIKGYGGLFCGGINASAMMNKFDIKKNIYQPDDDPTNPDKRHYFGETLTRRGTLPTTYPINCIGDESSPYRAKDLYSKGFPGRIGYSSYRPTLFTIPTKNSDFNIRAPFLSPVITLETMDKSFGNFVHSFFWLDLKLNTHFCYLNKTYLDPIQKANNIKDWSHKQFMKIPFDWHIKSMIKYGDTNKKEMFIYGGDYDVPIETVIKNLQLINKYLK